MKIIFRTSFVVLLFSTIILIDPAQTKQVNKVFVTGHMPGADKCTVNEISANSREYFYGKYKVYVSDHAGAPGQYIALRDPQTDETLKSFVGYEDSYFAGIYKDNYFLIDSGTSNVRSYQIYDISKRAYVFESIYMGGAIIENDRFYYLYPFINENLPYKPECKNPEAKQWKEWGTLGYTENRYFDFRSHLKIKTNEFKCAYFE